MNLQNNPFAFLSITQINVERLAHETHKSNNVHTS